MVELADVVLILAVAIIVLGPEDIVEIAHKWGRFVEKYSKVVTNVTAEVREALEPKDKALPPQKDDGPGPKVTESYKQEIENIMEEEEKRAGTPP
jgi:Sec-independent protein translocase protein TatA